MKAILLFALFLCVLHTAAAQNVGINTTGATPHESALLDVSSTTKGVLLPRMTSTQRTAIASPAQGLLVFDTTTNSFWFFNNSTWTNLAAGGITLPYSSEAASASPVFSISNTGSSAAIRGTGTTGPGLWGFGSSNGLAGVAIRAENSHTSGIGLWSITTSNDANMVVSNSGTGDIFRGFSGPGAGNLVYRVTNNGSLLLQGSLGIGTTTVPTTKLEVMGAVKITDGTQGLNKVLTSSANGTASWQPLPGSVAFKARNFSQQTIPPNTNTFLNATLEDFDASSNFFNSAFTAPVAGIYHFDVTTHLSLLLADVPYYSQFYLELVSNNTNVLARYVFQNPFETKNFAQTYVIGENLLLNQGDVLRVRLYGQSSNSGHLRVDTLTFSGFRVH